MVVIIKPFCLALTSSLLIGLLASCATSPKPPSAPASEISFSVDGSAVPPDAKPEDGKITKDQISDLNAFVNKMPTIGTPRHPLIATVKIDVPTPCHFPILTRSTDKGLGRYRVFVTLARIPGICAQVITSKDVRYEDPTFIGSFKTFSLELPDGESVEVDIGEVH